MVEFTVLLCLSLVALVVSNRYASQNPPWRFSSINLLKNHFQKFCSSRFWEGPVICI